MRRPPNLLVITSLGALAAFLLPDRSVSAAEAGFYVSLRYEADGSVRRCWGEAAFRQNVAQEIGYDPFRAGASAHVSIRIAGAARALEGLIEWRNTDGVTLGERRFVDEQGNCARLLTEMSFAVGMQIELLRPHAFGETGAPSTGGGASSSSSAPATAASSPAPAATASSPAPAATAPAAPARSTPLGGLAPSAPRPSAAPEPESESAAAAASARWPMWLGVGPSLAWGIAPTVTANARLFFGVRRGDLSLEVGAEASLPSSERRWDGSGFRESSIGVSASICGHRSAFSACLLGKASQVRIAGFGVDQPRSPTAFVAQAGLRLAAALEIGGPWSAAAHLDALGLLTPCAVDLNQIGVWEMPRLGAVAGIDVAARFR